jgi:hypothetical protein
VSGKNQGLERCEGAVEYPREDYLQNRSANRLSPSDCSCVCVGKKPSRAKCHSSSHVQSLTSRPKTRDFFNFAGVMPGARFSIKGDHLRHPPFAGAGFRAREKRSRLLLRYDRTGRAPAYLSTGVVFQLLIAQVSELSAHQEPSDIRLGMLRLLLGLFWRLLDSRRDLLLENLALRQQLLSLKRRKPRPRLARLDRLFWVVARRLWPKWKRRTGHRHTRDGSTLASSRIPTVLEAAFPA